MREPKILAIVGASGSGKTTLIEKLLPHLQEHDLQVATIKHSHHPIDLDVPGKDSWRHRQAGAMATLLVGPVQIQLVSDTPADASPGMLASRYFPDADLVLVEGFSSMPGAKIEVLRQRAEARPVAREGLIAMVTDAADISTDVPCFDWNDIPSIVDFILGWMPNAD